MRKPVQKVLIVDDDATVRKLLSIIVADQADFSVSQAEDGPSALKQIELDTPDILLADVQLPGMSGLDLIAAVRASYPHMRLIAMSGARESEGPPKNSDGFYMKDGCNWVDLIKILHASSALETSPLQQAHS